MTDIELLPGQDQLVTHAAGGLKLSYNKARTRVRVTAPGVFVPPDPPPPPPPPPPTGVSLADYGGNWITAIEAAKTHGNVLNVPAGTWPAPRIVPYAGLTIRGAGSDKTFVTRQVKGVGDYIGVFHVADVANVTISDLTVRGWPVASGPSDDMLIYGHNAPGLKVLRVNLENAQGAGIFLDGTTTGGLFEDITITNTLFKANGYHGVGLWLYHGASRNTLRRITVRDSNYSGVMIDAGTTVGTAASVDDNVFEDIVIRNAARKPLPGGAGTGYGFLVTGGQRNKVTRWEVTDQATGAALAFGSDQSGIGSSGNVFTTGTVLRIVSGDIITFGGTTGNVINGGTGSGHVSGASGNTITDWPGLS